MPVDVHSSLVSLIFSVSLNMQLGPKLFVNTTIAG